MHELSIARSLVELVAEEARAAGESRVLSVRLSLGALSGVAEEQLSFCFPFAARGTPLEGARLEVTRIAGIGRCRGCGEDFPMGHQLDPCPRCGSAAAELLAGRELRVESFNVE